MYNKISNVLKLLVAVGLLWFLFTLIDFNQFLEKIKNAKIYPLIVVALLYFPGVFISVLKWNNILKFYKIIFSKSQLFTAYLVSGFFNNFLPTSVGGDTYKFIYIKKTYPTFNKEIVSSIIIERGFGLLALFTINLILIFPFINFILFKTFFVTIELIIIIAFLFLLFIIFFRNKIFQILEKVEIRFNLFQRFKKFVKTIVSINGKKLVMVLFLYSLIFIIIGSFSNFLLFYSLGYKINIFYILFSYSIVGIFRILPISLNSIGISEGLYIFLFGIYGIEPEVSLAVAIIARILLILISSSGGIVYILGDFKKIPKTP